MPYVVKLADHGVAGGAGHRPRLHAGPQRRGGKLTYEPVANDQGLEFTPAAQALATVAA